MDLKKFNFYFGGFLAAVGLTLMVIVAELFTPFKTGLAGLFGHHWIGKGVLTAALFLLGGYFVREEKKHEKWAWNASIAALALIFLFYIWHYYTAG